MKAAKTRATARARAGPAEAVVKVTSATIILTAGKPEVPKDISWAAAKKMMKNVDQFLDSLWHQVALAKLHYLCPR